MRNYLSYLLIFLLPGCGGKSLEGNSISIPGSSGKIGIPKSPLLKKEETKHFFSLGPYITVNFNQPNPIYQLNWLTNDRTSSFEVEYGTLKEGRKEASLIKKDFSKEFQFYSASFSPLIIDKDYSCTILRNSLSCYSQPFKNISKPLKWSAVLITKPSSKKTKAIQKLNPQWIFTSWQPKDWIEINKQKTFFDIPSRYIWNPLNKEFALFRSSLKNDLSFSLKPVLFKLEAESKPMTSTIPVVWLTPQKIVFTGFSTSLEILGDGFIYMEKNDKDFFCLSYDSKGNFLKKYLLDKA